MCSAVFKSPKSFRFGQDCTSTSSARCPCNLRPQADVTISVFRGSEYRYYACPDPVPLLLAAPLVIHEKSCESIDVVERPDSPLKSCTHSSKSCNSSLRNSSSSSVLCVFHADGFLRDSFRADHSILREDVDEAGEDEVEELVDRQGTFAILQLIPFPLLVRCGFLTACPVVGVPMVFVELPK